MAKKHDTGLAASEAPGRRSARPALLAGLLAAALAAAYALLTAAPLRLAAIEVAGVERLSPERVKWAAGLDPGALRWRHPPAAIRERILQREPWVADATVEWSAGGRLQIKVRERTPVAQVPYYHLFAVLDAQGTILAVATPTEHDLPLITGLPLVKGLRGEQIGGTELAAALAVAGRLPPALHGTLSEVHAAPTGDLTLVFSGPLLALVGPPTSLEDKLLALASIYPEARRRGADIDLRNPRRPTLRPR